jgi:hypothetical protein
VRQPYVPLFRDLLSSPVWDEPTATRAVWIWFMCSADPEGFVGGTLRSVARGANVSLDEARAALEFLCSPDDESRDDEHDGRMLEPTERGWRVLNLTKWRERAQLEAERARKRRWAESSRRPPMDDDGLRPLRAIPDDPYDAGTIGRRVAERSGDVDARSESVDATKPKPTPKPTPEPLSEEPSPVRGVEHTELPEGWQPSPALVAHAIGAGVPEDYLRERIDGLRGRRIGGQTPITNLDRYIQGLVRRWRRDYETEGFKRSRASPANDGPPRPKGLPAWVHPDHVELARARGVDLGRAVAAFAKQHQLHRSEPEPSKLFRMFRDYLGAIEKGAA